MLIINRAWAEVVLADIDLLVILDPTADQLVWFLVHTIGIHRQEWVLLDLIRAMSHVLMLQIITSDCSLIFHLVIVVHLLHQKVLSCEFRGSLLLVRVRTNITLFMTLHTLLILFGNFLFFACTFLKPVNHLIGHSRFHPVFINVSGRVLLENLQMFRLHLHFLKDLWLWCELKVWGSFRLLSLLFSELVKGSINSTSLYFWWFFKHGLNFGFWGHLKFAKFCMGSICPLIIPLSLVSMLSMIFLE